MANAPLDYARGADHVGVLTLTRADTQNRMTLELLDAFAEAIDAITSDGDLRCLVITGQGAYFSAGADLTRPLNRPRGGLPHEASYAMYEAFLRVLDVRIPVVAAVNGHAVGGGLGLALLCDIRVVDQAGKYGTGFARIGIHSGLGISYLLPRLVGVSRAAELLFTGKTITGLEAVDIGLASEALPSDAVLERALVIAREIALAGPIAVREMKRSLYEGLGWQVRAAARVESLRQAETLMTEDAAEGVAAMLAHRRPEFRGR